MSNLAAANITTTLLTQRRNNGRSYYNVKLAFGNAALTYPSGGVPVTPATFGLTNSIESVHFYDTGGSGYVWQYDYTNSKIRIYESRDQDWVSFTPTGTWVANTTYTGKVRASGDTAWFAVKVALAGAPTSASLTVTIPAAYTFDTTKISSATADAVGLGFAGATHSSAFEQFFCAQSATANSVDVFYISSASTAAMTAVDATHPITWANTDEVNLLFTAPITGFGGGQTNGLYEPVGFALAAQNIKCEVIGW